MGQWTDLMVVIIVFVIGASLDTSQPFYQHYVPQVSGEGIDSHHAKD